MAWFSSGLRARLIMNHGNNNDTNHSTSIKQGRCSHAARLYNNEGISQGPLGNSVPLMCRNGTILYYVPGTLDSKACLCTYPATSLR